ncbi:MAG: NADH-quinone oxidoreductase subunit C [Lachnospiraceae bacterium]|nr:NADH-quinone oxidoreductase subunit C [Lachnospiraceae bacterium]
MENIWKDITEETLLNEVQVLRADKYRLVQQCARKTEEGNYELLYSFGKGYDAEHLKFQVAPGQSVQSISHIFPPAFLYENEIHDLFGIEIKDITLDFRGGLYRTAVKAPFA